MPPNPRRKFARRHPGSKTRPSSSQHSSLGGGLDRTSIPLCPVPSERMASVFLTKPTTHPTVYRKRIKHIDGRPDVGDWVSIYHQDAREQDALQSDNPDDDVAPRVESDQPPKLFAYGLYNPKSEIAVRIVRWSQELPNDAFFDNLLDRAVALRVDTLRLNEVTDSYRVIHAEADGLPGLVVDRYGDCLSAEVFGIAMAQRAEAILERLAKRLGTRHWLIQPSPALKSQEGFSMEPRSSSELPSQVTITEHGTKFRIHFGTGHKTGFFCDQRENRLKLAEYCRDRTVLDVCCYTGGFAVQAAKLGGAREVTGIDLDEEPLKTARQNAALNDVRVKFTQADAFAYMRDMLREGKQFDVVVLDPPKLIRNRMEIEEGTRKHFDLNRLAMQLVRPGGMMLTCSCAGLLQDSEFLRVVRAAGRSAFAAAPRNIQFLSRAGAAACHPVSATCPETEYLKAMWVRL
jgi:23S rRNA (cytosine1962-C5)-methyltransferase